MQTQEARPAAAPSSSRRVPAQPYTHAARRATDPHKNRRAADFKVVVTGFQSYTQHQDLVRAFSKFGNVKVEKLNTHLAILSFSTEEESKAAVKASQKVNIYGEFLTVKPHTVSLADEETRIEKKPRMTKRDFIRSKQKGTIIEPKQIDLSGDFHQQLDSILAAVRLTQEDVTVLSALYTDVEMALQAQWPGCTAIPFGSITTGLGVKTSDADCFVNIPEHFRHPHANFVNKAKKILQQYPKIFTEILSIPRANTPIVKFFHFPTQTNCDLTFKTPLGAQNSKLISFMLNSDPRLLPMAVVIKYWARVHELSGTGKLTNYALTLLIIFYLQQAPISILPSVQWLQRDAANDIFVDSWNTGFMARREALPPSSNTSSISELLGGFFEYYTNFNFEEMVACPFLGVLIKKDIFKDTNQLPDEFERYKLNVNNNIVMPLRYTTAICIQDPFEQCHNVASPITTNLAADIKAYFKFAANAYEKEKLNKCDGLFFNILLLKPKIVRNKAHPEFRVPLFPRIIIKIEDSDWKSVVRDIVFTIFEKMLKIKLTKVDEKVNQDEIVNQDEKVNQDKEINQDNKVNQDKKVNQDNKVNQDKKVNQDNMINQDKKVNPDKKVTQDKKREKEKYSATITKAIWKRKQFNKLYSVMNLHFPQKQERITEEILSVEKQQINIQFHVYVTYSSDPMSSVISIKFDEGNVEMFKEFGKFFQSITQNWFMLLLKPYMMKDSAEKVAETIEILDNKLAANNSANSDDDSINANAQSDGLNDDDATQEVASTDVASELNGVNAPESR